MKRRWAAIALPSLACLIGWSWLATRWDTSTMQLGGVRMLGMLVTCVVSFIAMRRDLRAKWPAMVALAGTAPMLILTLRLLRGLGLLLDVLGAPFVLVLVGGVVASLAALVVAIAPLPRPPADPPVAPARVVEG